MTEEIVSSENLSLQLLKDLFTSAYLKVDSIDANFIRVTEEDLWVRVNVDEQGKRFIHFTVAFPLDKQKTHAQRLEFINRVNATLIFIRAELFSPKDSDEFAAFDYHLWVEGGVTKHNIISTLREFARAINFAASQDTEGILA